jgi:hypothetical protein
MNRDSTALVAPARSVPPALPTLGPVLIRVPTLGRDQRRRGSHSGGRTLVGRRRRLRREVRVTATAFLVVGPLGLAMAVFQGAGPPSQPAVAARLTGIEFVAGSFAPEEPHAQSLPVLAPALRVSVPAKRPVDAAVVLPGYVLPDDGSEEPAHAGG